MARNANPARAGGAAGEVPGGDFTENKPTTSAPNPQAPRTCWLALLDQAEERSRCALEQRPKHRKLYKYLAARLARVVLAEVGR